MLPVYTCSPLPDSHIRLLQLLPSRDDHAPIECKLVDYHLLDPRKGLHLYEAVSYVWGPPPNTHRMIADGACLPIRQNCHAIPTRPRDPALPRFLWVDALCINQEDNNEKTDQVQLMAWIYASARGVIVWLEEPTDICQQGEYGKGQISRALQAIRAAAENSPLAKALWHPKISEVWPSSPAGWENVPWMPPGTGPLFDVWRSDALLRSFLDRCGDKVPITAKVMVAAIDNPVYASAMVRILSDFYRDQVQITSAV
ncbi:hypothetical protein OQA88_7447 [Cercophora sp. LCS_1]